MGDKHPNMARMAFGLGEPPEEETHYVPFRTKIADVVSPDTPTITNEKGASQSKVDVRFDLIDGPALFQMAAVLHTGAEKYGVNNWRGIEVDDHLNHLIIHAYAYLSGDRTDDHLSHIMCRSMFAQAVAITDEKIMDAACDLFHPGEECIPGNNHPEANREE